MSEEDDENYREEQLILKMIKLLQDNGWDFNTSRDPVLVLIEVEEIENGESDNE